DACVPAFPCRTRRVFCWRRRCASGGPTMPIKLTSEAAGVRLALKVVPGASRDRVVGELGDALKVAVSKPPESGAANRAVVKLLARALDVSEANITLVRGHGSPRKEILVTGLSVQDLSTRLAELTDV